MAPGTLPVALEHVFERGKQKVRGSGWDHGQAEAMVRWRD